MGLAKKVAWLYNFPILEKEKDISRRVTNQADSSNFTPSQRKKKYNAGQIVRQDRTRLALTLPHIRGRKGTNYYCNWPGQDILA